LFLARFLSSRTVAGILLWGSVILSPYGAIFACTLNIINDYSSIITMLPNVGACIAIMICESAAFLAFAYYTDMQSSIPLKPHYDETTDEASLEALDEDVKEERERTLALNISEKKQQGQLPPLVLQRLRKYFAPAHSSRTGVLAVEDLALTVEKGEIFGLLGPNGKIPLGFWVFSFFTLSSRLTFRSVSVASPSFSLLPFLFIGAGKTTTLSMLTRLLIPTSGDGLVAGHSVLTDFAKGARGLGIVTQNNALWDKLSVEDHLYLFARLRGVPEDLVTKVVNGVIDQLELSPHRRKLAMNLSGGMKRKLCVAIALIGDPEVVLLDEPSAGLDPVSRHNLWSVILKTMSNRAVILTTHSMEEAEALCKRIGVMINGQMRALGEYLIRWSFFSLSFFFLSFLPVLRLLGSKLHLKNKYGSGFELTVKLKGINIEREMEELTKYVTSLFDSAVILSHNGGLITYQIPREEMKMSVAFTSLYDEKEALSIEEFTVAQPTLEQVRFISFF
jgi:ABC-type multidrug transport system ATPase subunit